MKATVNHGGEEIERILMPFIESITHEQNLAIAGNKDENLQLQNQITELKKECTQLQYLIITATKQLEKLEGEVGSYR